MFRSFRGSSPGSMALKLHRYSRAGVSLAVARLCRCQELLVIDPQTGKLQVVVNRRRTRRHRRNRMIRRAIAAALLAIFTAGISVLALQYFSPSLFRAKESAPPSLEQAEL